MKLHLLYFTFMLFLLCACGGGSIGTGTGLPPVKSLVGGLTTQESDALDELDFINELLGLNKPVTIQISLLGECKKYFDQVDEYILKRNSVTATKTTLECEAIISVPAKEFKQATEKFTVYASTCEEPAIWTYYSEGTVSKSGSAVLELPTLDSPTFCRIRIGFPMDDNVRGAYINLKAPSN
jgi:hypothetical protein